MKRPLAGRAILIIEDEVLIALDIQEALEEQGAETTTARTIAAALLAIEDPVLSAAIVDHALGDGDSSVLCQRLKERDVPFITHSGYANLDGACAGTKHLTKPTSGSLLVSHARVAADFKLRHYLRGRTHLFVTNEVHPGIFGVNEAR